MKRTNTVFTAENARARARNQLTASRKQDVRVIKCKTTATSRLRGSRLRLYCGLHSDKCDSWNRNVIMCKFWQTPHSVVYKQSTSIYVKQSTSCNFYERSTEWVNYWELRLHSISALQLNNCCNIYTSESFLMVCYRTFGTIKTIKTVIIAFTEGKTMITRQNIRCFMSGVCNPYGTAV